MNLEKLEALVGAMTKEQYLRFETAVFQLLENNELFSKSEMIILEKKVQAFKTLQREKLMVVNN